MFNTNCVIFARQMNNDMEYRSIKYGKSKNENDGRFFVPGKSDITGGKLLHHEMFPYEYALWFPYECYDFHMSV